MNSTEIISKYIRDLKDIGDQMFIVNSSYYKSGTGDQKELYKFTPFDLVQIELNIPLEPHENLKDLLSDMGYEFLVSEGVEFLKPKEGESKQDEDTQESPAIELPMVDINKLGIIEAIDLAYNLNLVERTKEKREPIDVIDLSYEIKNDLKFPDEFFNDFPSKLMETPFHNSIRNSTGYGLIQGFRAYYNFFQVSNNAIFPISSFPAAIDLSQNINTEGLIMALKSKFKSFSETKDFNVYNTYRMVKNIKNKCLMRQGKPCSISLFSKPELEWSLSSGLFQVVEEKLSLLEGKVPTDLSDLVNEYAMKAECIVKKWKNMKLF